MKTIEEKRTAEPASGSAPIGRGTFLKAAGAGAVLGLLAAWQEAPQEALAAFEDSLYRSAGQRTVSSKRETSCCACRRN
jgi:hypothetical protein